MNLSTSDRATLKLKFGGRCAYCGSPLSAKWHADHVEPVLREWWKNKQWRKGNAVVYEYDKKRKVCVPRPATSEELSIRMQRPENDTLDNLFPSCIPCNIDKHCSTLESWRKQLEDKVAVCRRNYSAFRHAERFGLVMEIKKPVICWFEQYEDSLLKVRPVTFNKELANEKLF